MGEELEFIIPRSQVGHNIYKTQTWITHTNTKSVFISRVITLDALLSAYKCLLDDDAYSFTSINSSDARVRAKK